MADRPDITAEHEEAGQQERERTDLEARISRSYALRLEAVLERRSRGFVVVVGLLLLALIGLIDAVTGAFAVSVFYLVPIGLVTFGRGRWMGLLTAGIASIAWSAVEIVQHVTSLDSSVPYWNALTRFYAYAAVVLLIAPIRKAMVMERQLAEREADSAEQLRALNELREVALQAGLTEHEARTPN